MDKFWALVEQGGVSQAECAQLKNLGWDNYGITAKAGDALRKLLIRRIGMAPGDFTDKFFASVVTSYATGARKDLGEGNDGPGSVWNFLVCLAIDLGGKGMPMTGMHFKEGKFFEGYMKCVNKTTAKSLGKQVATHMVVLLSNAFFQSPMCMVEVHHAIHSGIRLVLVAIEELEWPRKFPGEEENSPEEERRKLHVGKFETARITPNPVSFCHGEVVISKGYVL